MTLDEYRSTLRRIDADAGRDIEAATSLAELDDVKARWVGRARGALTDHMKALPTLPAEDRREAGRETNEVKSRLEGVIEAKREALAATAPAPRLDPTMPARHPWRGARHPVTLVIDEIVAIFREIGFTVATGPEAEWEWYNFSALNFPAEHPAMDMHDTLYLGDDTLLRTHTSPVQVRTLQRYPPPIRILAPGNVYRRDFFDASHAPMFAQVEGLAVDEGISFVDLKATLTLFANRFFGETRTRFRPSYFPFVEPGAEMDVQCRICGGGGCATCKGTGWVEILGAGMVHPAVLEAAGLDANRYSGWAFGMGPGRIAMTRFGIPDIRLLYDSDVRFLEQFAT